VRCACGREHRALVQPAETKVASDRNTTPCSRMCPSSTVDAAAHMETMTTTTCTDVGRRGRGGKGRLAHREAVGEDKRLGDA
jgi:hypothetical protein